MSVMRQDLAGGWFLLPRAGDYFTSMDVAVTGGSRIGLPRLFRYYKGSSVLGFPQMEELSGDWFVCLQALEWRFLCGKRVPYRK